MFNRLFKKKASLLDEPPKEVESADNPFVAVDAPKKGNKQKVAKQPKAVKKSKKGAANNQYVLDVRIENDAHIFYAIGLDGDVTVVPEPDGDEVIVSCVYPLLGRQEDDAADDVRCSLPKKMTSSEASNYVQREMGLLHKVRTTVSRHDNVFVAHSTTLEKTKRFSTVLPFARAVEFLLAQHGTHAPCVAGVLFGESSLLLLLAYPGNGKVLTQTAISPDNLPEIIGSFVSSVNIGVGLEDAVIFDGKELISALSKIDAYPAHSDIYGVPFPVVAKNALVIACASAVVIDGGYVYEYQQNKQLIQSQNAITVQQAAVTTDIAERLKSNVPVFLKKANIDSKLFFSHASDFYVNGAKVSSSAVTTGEIHRVILPLREKDLIANAKDIENVLHKSTLPAGCSLTKTTLSSALTALETDYQCVTPTTFVATFSQPLQNEVKP
jgi:hypothetical protein